TPTANEDFTTWPVCPATPVCPDINNNVPSRKTLNCPTQCTVAEQLGTVDTLITNKYSSFTPAACPAGYSEVAQFNVGDEITQFPNSAYPNGFVATNIPSMAALAQYQNEGFACTPALGSSLSSGPNFTSCHTGSGPPGNLSTLATQTYGYSTAATGTVAYFWMWDNGTCFTNCGSSAQVEGSCSISWTSRRYQYYYVPVVCNGGAGFFDTGRQIPTSVACAQVQALWIKQNQAPAPSATPVQPPNKKNNIPRTG